MTLTAGPASWLTHWADLRPGATALITPVGRRLSFRRLDRIVDTVAAGLARLGVREQTMVCVQSSEPVETRLLRLGANRCGAVDVLFDPASPPAEVARRTAILDGDAVFLDEGTSAKLCSAADEPFPARQGQPDPQTSGRVLFTTGSTGAPRAVLHLADRLDSAARSNAWVRSIGADDLVLAALPPHHAAGSLFEDTALYVGAGVALIRQDTGTAAQRLMAALRFHRPSVVSVVPAMLGELVEETEGIEALRLLRLLNYAGEAAPPSLVERLVRVFPGELYRGYGLTEAGPLVAVLNNEDHRSGTPDPAALGRPAPGVSVRLCPADGGGCELLVRSGHVMNRYLNAPQATRAALQDGWLHTGDLVTMHYGVLIHRGRLGNRIRSGGEWIDLDEVRQALERAPAVTEAVVVSVASERWGQRPVAFVTGTPALDVDLVRKHLADELSRFKRPDRIQIMSQLPRTAAGKVDYDLLRRMTG
jgi:acyl-CoA synthetase (AMP-forming)/AMP-acid ligase II